MALENDKQDPRTREEIVADLQRVAEEFHELRSSPEVDAEGPFIAKAQGLFALGYSPRHHGDALEPFGPDLVGATLGDRAAIERSVAEWNSGFDDKRYHVAAVSLLDAIDEALASIEATIAAIQAGEA